MALPDRLNNEPLIDAIFECRFQAEMPMSSVLPGFLVGKLSDIKSVNNLPAMELPPGLRNSDQNLFFAPLVQIEWKGFNISVGDRNIVVGCKLPYPRWSKFKSAILEVLTVLSELNSIKSVQRYSVKYVDLIPSKSFSDQADLINLDLSIGKFKQKNEKFYVRLDLSEDGFSHILNVVAGASVDFENGEHREGLVIDTDSICNSNESESFAEWTKHVAPALDKLHQSNKSIFFGCLSENGLKLLEPVYA